MRRLLALALILLGCGARSSLRSGDSGVTEGDADVDAPSTDDAPDDDGGTIADAPMDADGDTPVPVPKVPRLFLSTSTGIVVYDHPESATSASTPSTILNHFSLIDGPGRPEGLGVLGTRLFVGFSAPHVPVIAIFDHADTIVGAAAPSGQITASDVFNGASTAFRLFSADPASDTLWAHSSCCGHPGTQLFRDASTMKANTNATTLFAPTDGTMYRLFFDPTTNRLVTGVESDPTLRVWSAATTKWGTVAPAFVLANGSYREFAVAKNRLYAASLYQPRLDVWSGFGSLTGPTAPSFSMTGAASGLDLLGLIRFVTVVNDVLFVTFDDVQGVASGHVNVYPHASTLAGNTLPTTTMKTAVGVYKVVLGKSDRLYVMEGIGAGGALAIFDHATTSPTLVARFPIASGISDMVLME